MMKNRKGHIESLQAGRALATLAVALHHSALAARDFVGGVPYFRFFEAGYLGVDFFFVLSGFIIYHSSQGKSISDYAAARFRRLYLPYWPVGLGLAVLYSCMPHFNAGDRHWSWLPTITLFPVTAGTSLSVAWTLKHEVFFYLVFGALFLRGWLTFGLTVWTVTIFVSTFLDLAPNVPLATINLEFILGVVVAVAHERDWRSLWWLGVFAGSLAFWIILGANRNQSLLVGVAFAAAILPITRLEQQGQLRIGPTLLLLGDASYSIYLTHGVAISLAARVLARFGWGIVLVGGVAAGIVAGLTYHFFCERPLLRLGRRLIRGRLPRQGQRQHRSGLNQGLVENALDADAPSGEIRHQDDPKQSQAACREQPVAGSPPTERLRQSPPEAPLRSHL